MVFSGGRLDRLSEERDEQTLTTAIHDHTARFVAIDTGNVLLTRTGEDTAACLFSYDGLVALNPRFDRAVLLGTGPDGPRLAVPVALPRDSLDETKFDLAKPLGAMDFRTVARKGVLSADAYGDVAYGAALLAWHATSRFCARCGGQTVMRQAGAKRQCVACERDHYPRTAPVVIMLIHSTDERGGERCLLGRSHHFPPGMYSALAGFIEPGETMEMAVRRETFEESGIRVGEVRYHATQPWPFPHTLMIGCLGEALESDIHRDEGELGG